MKTREERIEEIINKANYRHSFGETSRIEGEVFMAQKAISVIDELQKNLEQEKGQRDFYREKYLKAYGEFEQENRELREKNQRLHDTGEQVCTKLGER